MSHIRQLSWLLLGSLTHCALHQGSTSCMPIPLDAGSHIADHLIVILIGFPEQSKVHQQINSIQICLLFHMWPDLRECSINISFPFSFTRHLFSTCAPCSMPSCLLSCGQSTVSKQLQHQLGRTKTRTSSPQALFLQAWSSGAESHPASFSLWPTTK